MTEAEVGTVAELFDLYRQFYGQPADRALARAFIRARLEHGQSALFLAVSDDGAGLGFTQLYPSFCSVEAVAIQILYDLYVRQAARGRGVARALMEHAQDYACRSGARRLELATAVDNHAAQRLYEALGWKRDEAFYHYALSV